MRLPRSIVVLSVVAASAGCGGDSQTARSDPVEPTPVVTGAPAVQEAETGGALKLRLVRVASGLDQPVAIVSAPGEREKLFVVEQTGRIRVLQGGRVVSGAFLDISGLVSCCGEQGLLSVAFHPRYPQNRLFYVNYTNSAGDTVVAEYRSRSTGAPARVRQLLLVEQPYQNHNGGQLQFGPDGYLYTGMGDGGSGGDPENRAQNPSSRLGKLLRLNVGEQGGGWEIVGSGLRNPWRFSFDRRTGDLYIGDVGQGAWEEIDFTPRSSPGLENYGWDVWEGTHRFEDKEPSGGELVFPIYEYSHDEGCSVTGGYVYRGAAIPAARGRYFFGDYCSGSIWSLTVRDGKAAGVRKHRITVDNLTAFGESTTGELYLLSQGGTIYRLARG
jgi:glucose/arabinose dehydrogenase